VDPRLRGEGEGESGEDEGESGKHKGESGYIFWGIDSITNLNSKFLNCINIKRMI
jgi:hypothetical protein